MINISVCFDFSIDIKERLRLIKQAGFNGVMLMWGGQHDVTDYILHPEYAKNIGLHIENVHLPHKRVNDLWLDTLDGQDFEKNLIGYVDDCFKNSIKTMVMHPTVTGTPPLPSEIGINRLKVILEYAEKKDVKIALENLKRVNYLQYIFERINSNNLGFCYDSGHNNWCTPGLDLLSMYGSKLMAVHLNDNDGCIHNNTKDDQHRMPFDGTLDWKTVMKNIANTGYKGAVSLEIEKLGYEQIPIESFLTTAYERACRLVSIITSSNQ